MARRDVDLVIRARDEAVKVLDQITAALDNFRDAQKGVDSGAEKTESSLGQLGAAIATLQKQLGGLEIADKLAGELQKAEKELVRLEDRFAETQREAADLDRQLARSGDQAARFAQKAQGATDALSRQKGVVKQAKADQRELSAAYDASEKAQAKLATRQEKLPSLIEKQAAALGSAKARYAELADQISRTAEPSRTLQQQFEASSRNVDRNAAKLTKLENEYQQITGQLRAAGSAMTIFGEQSRAAESNVARQVRVLGKIEDNLTSLKGKSKAAADEQSRLAGAFDRINSSLSRQGEQINRAEANYVDLAQAAGKADAALEKLSQAAIGKLGAELKDQKRSALEAKREYLGLTDAAGRLAAKINATTNPSKRLREEFDKTVAQAREAKQVYIQQRETLTRMGRAYREAGADIGSIRAVQEQFSAILRENAAGLQKIDAAAAEAAANLDRLYGSSQRAKSGMSGMARTSGQLASANQRGAEATGALASAYRQFYGDTRKSLSLLQRIRGEVLALIAAYGGLYAVIGTLRGTVDAYQQLEAAQARLNVATNGDQNRTAAELDFLRRTADRLGISFGTLATEYSKFAIATKGTNLEGENTRKIFTAVAEAARVNRSSTKEMAGVFVALTQIVSKGAVQMEELRQQLGDRLPGAIKIMADGLGVSTAQLVKMMEQGQITSDALVPFANELNKRFGGQLPDALNSVSVSLGRLANEAFKALVRFGEGGFLESFQNLVNQLIQTMQSADFRAFSDRASKAFGTLVDALAFAVEHFRVLAAVASAFLGLKLAPLVIGLATAFSTLTAGTTKTGVAFSVLQARAAAMGVTITRVGYAIKTLRAAFIGLLSTTGIGLLIAAVGAGIALWATEADDATEAMVEHERIVNAVKNAYDAVGGSVENWNKALQGVTVTEARRNLESLGKALLEATKQFDTANSQAGSTFSTRFFGINLTSVSKEYQSVIGDVLKRLREGKIGYADLVSEIDKVNEKFNDGSDVNRRYAESLVDAAKKVVKQKEAWDEARLVVEALTGSQEEQQKALDQLNGKVTDAVEPAKDFANAFEEMSKHAKNLADDVPKATTKTEEAAQEAEKLAEAYQKALTAARSLPDAIQRAAAEQKVFAKYAEGMAAALAQAEGSIAKQYDQFTSGQEAAAAFIRKKEGFRSSPYYDVNAYRAGFGSDTVTLADGSIKKVTQGMSVSIADANRDLARRIATEFEPAVKAAVGADRYNALTPQQQAALVSLAYNYGSGAFAEGKALAGVAAAVRAGSKEGVVQAITARAGDNNGVNRARRLEEAALYNTNAGVDYVVKEQAKIAEKQQKFREGLNDDIETLRQEAEVQGKSIILQEQQKALREAELEAKKVGLTLTEKEREAIKANVAAKFAQKQAEEDVKNAKEKAVAAERKVNALLEQRRALDAQLKYAKEDGDTAKQAELQQKLAEVNTELESAIANAKAMWQAIGGDDADVAMTKLDTAAMKADNLDKKAEKNYLDWSRVGDLFVNGLANAFDVFAQKVAEGSSIGEAARVAFLQFAADFLREIAQMILKQAIFNALRAAFGGSPFGALIGLGHTGGMVGSSRVGSGNRTRKVNPMIFAAAQRFHSGGMIGLAPNEVPIIAKQGEEMLTRDDPRHMLNGGLSGGGQRSESKRPFKIVNAFDSPSFLEQALATDSGMEVFLNFVRANSDEMKSALEG